MAGETALARQLKKLAVPQTSLLNQGNARKSFLFYDREAATKSRDDIFSIGTTGLEKLMLLNPTFEKFKHNLFNPSYKDFERSVQTASVNKKLDEKITEFLRMLTTYFLVKGGGSGEALEWLIYRYHIHLYNVDALMEAVLPHYNTNSFVKVVQLLNLDDPGSRWAWLLPVKKSGVPLEYAAIVNHFNADGGFRKFVCELASNHLKVFKKSQTIDGRVISFSVLTIYSALGKSGAVTDGMITFLFPYILKGLKSGMNNYITATYLVISRIMISVKLTEDLVNQLLMKVFEDVKVDLLQEACEVLLLAFQQQSIEKLSKELFSLLLSQKSCMKYLANMSEQYEAASLSSALIRMSVASLFRSLFQKHKKQKSQKLKNKFKKLYKFTRRIVEMLFLDEKTLNVFFNSILSGYSKFFKKSNIKDEALKKTAKLLLKSLESKYPEHFDKAINSYFKKKKDENKKHLCSLINEAVCSLKNKVMKDKRTTLILGIYHSNPKIRKTSIKYLINIASSKKISDKAFVENSLSERLLDDSCDVVSAVLSSAEVLLKYLEKEKVLSSFEQLLKKKITPNSPWYPVQMTCLDILCNHFSTEEELANEIFLTLLPFIFPLQKSTAPGFLRILKSELGCIIPVIQVLAIPHKVTFNGDSENDAKQLVQLNNTVVASLRKYVSKLSDSSKTLFLSFLKKKSLTTDYPPLLTVFVLASSEAITSDSKLEEKRKWIESLLSFLHTFPRPEVVIDEFNPDMTEETANQRCVHLLWKGHFPGVVIFHEFFKIVKSMKLKCPVLASNPWLCFKKGNEQHYTAFKILTLIFEFCVQQIKQSEPMNGKPVFTKNLTDLFTAFVKYQFKSPECLFGFLSLLWSNASEDVPVLLQVSALETAQDSLDPLLHFDWCFKSENQVSFSNVIFTSLLKAVSSPHAEVRREALTLLQSLLQTCSTLKCPSKSLGEVVCDQQEEINTDHNQCATIISNWLQPSFELYGYEDSVKDSVIKTKYSVLESFMKLLLEEDIPNTMKHQLLLFLDKADSIKILSTLIPLINKSLDEDVPFYKSLELLLGKFTIKTASCLKNKCAETDVLFKCLQLVEKEQAKHIPIILPILKILNREFFKAIPSVEVQKKILDVLLNAYLSSTAEVNAEIKKVLGKLSTYAYLILKDVQDKEVSIQKSATLRDVKKSRSKEETENSNMFETRPWKKITVLLEMIQNKSKLHKRELLVPELFNLLNKTLNHDKESSVEYLRQLILSTIYNCCKHLGPEELDERQFQVEYIVRCIRFSTNPKTHYQSLLLLTLAATMFPDNVLDNVMSIFTFMGSSLVRQDDSYSFEVISATIKTIVPALLKASNHMNESEAMQVVARQIRVFVDSLRDIPRHRQLPLFSTLIHATLEPSQYLWVPLGQICAQYAAESKVVDDFKFSSILDFAVNLHKQFSPDVQIDTCINLLNFISMLPDYKDGPGSEAVRNLTEPFNVSSSSDEQLQIYKFNVLSYINVWFSSEAFVSQMSGLERESLKELGGKIDTLLKKVLQFLQRQRVLKTDNNSNQHNLFPLLLDLMRHVNSLLPSDLFIKAIERLIKSSELVIQKQAIMLLCDKLEHKQHQFMEEQSKKNLLDLLKPLLEVVEKYNDKNLDNEEDSVVSQQTALYALQLLTRIIGSENPEQFHEVLEVTIQILNDKTNEELVINALICLAQLCSSMNVQVLPQLNTFMPLIVDLLTSDDILEMNDSLILGVITALMSLVKNLGAFLSTYMSSLVTGVCLLTTKYPEVNKRAVHEKLIAFQMMLSEDVDLRILLTAVEDSYSQIDEKDSDAIASLMEMLEEKLTLCSYTDIEACSSQLQLFFIKLLEFRNSHFLKSTVAPQSINSIELSIFSALRTFVMKVSVIHFQAFFKKIYLWATATELKLPHRLFTFYGLTNELSKTLKNLFVVVAKTFLKNAASELDSHNVSKDNTIEFANQPHLQNQHLNNILDTLKTCFINDDGHLLDKDSFEALLQPLVDQLDNVGRDEEAYQKRISQHLGSCVGHFMAAVSDNALWKKLNYQILLKTRDDSPVVRFAAIQVIREVVVVMGDNYLVLLAESIPFLAEVMEDESAEVEQECQTVIAEMEKILGEPIKKYF